MKRRKFVKEAGVGLAGITLLPAMGLPLRREKTNTDANEEFKKAVEIHVSKIFNSQPDLEIISPKGRYFFAESFTIDLNTMKNCIFDFADEIIVKAKSMGFDASPVKAGKIPQGMQITNGGVAISMDNKVNVFKLRNLRDWDATVIYRNCIHIFSEAPPALWSKLDKIEPMPVGKGYEGMINGRFRIWVLTDKSQHLYVEKTSPSIKFLDNTDEINTLNSKVLYQILPESVLKVLSSIKK